MNQIRKLLPKKRFKKFIGKEEWKKYELGQLGNVAMNRRIFKDQTTNKGEIPFYKIGTFGGEPDAFISRELFEKYKIKYPYPKIGDILISASGSIGRTIEYKGKDEYFQDSNIVWLNHDERLINSFLKQFYEIVNWQGVEGSTIKRLYNKNILLTEIFLPTIKEQTQIGEFFKKLDTLIQTQQKKLEKTKTLKAAYFVELFPKDNEFNPKIRFKGMKDNWMHFKLKDVIERELKGKTKATMLGNENIYLDANYLNGGEINYVNASKDVTLNDVLILWDGSLAGTVYHGFEGALGSTLKAYKPKESGQFLYQFLKKNQQNIFDNYRTPNIPHVIKTFTEEFRITIPDIKEQTKIGNFFKLLDQKIALEQRKLEKLNNIKQAYLNEMFV